MEPKEKKAFEPSGLVPRSIVRTFERFRQQLLPGSETAAIREYRISRYQVLVSARCLFTLLTIPIATNWLVSNWLLAPLIEHFWNTQQNEIFLNSYQEERAFAELEFFSEKLFFESLLDNDNDTTTPHTLLPVPYTSSESGNGDKLVTVLLHTNEGDIPSHTQNILPSVPPIPLKVVTVGTVVHIEGKEKVCSKAIQVIPLHTSLPSWVWEKSTFSKPPIGSDNLFDDLETKFVYLSAIDCGDNNSSEHNFSRVILDENLPVDCNGQFFGMLKNSEQSYFSKKDDIISQVSVVNPLFTMHTYKPSLSPQRNAELFWYPLSHAPGTTERSDGSLYATFPTQHTYHTLRTEGTEAQLKVPLTSLEEKSKHMYDRSGFSGFQNRSDNLSASLISPFSFKYNGSKMQVEDIENFWVNYGDTIQVPTISPKMYQVGSSKGEIKTKEKIQEKILELAVYYNQQTILSITNIVGDLVSLVTLASLFVWMKPEITILKSFLIEAIYSLSDTTKSFLLILLTDLLVGFHSPRGWETALELLLKHLGLPENQDFVFLFVATFPVLLDTVFKYWIFRHLNKISPSTVATYHSMIE